MMEVKPRGVKRCGVGAACGGPSWCFCGPERLSHIVASRTGAAVRDARQHAASFRRWPVQ